MTTWCGLPQKGIGVTLYKEYTPANFWIKNHRGLLCNEWCEAIKMTANVCSVRAVPGRSQDGTLCRRCRREKETLAHVLGFCPYGQLLRNSRHHKIRSLIADELRMKNFHVHEEVHGLASTGSTRRIDIIAYEPNSKKGYIIDPTVRFEHHVGQPDDINVEKQNTYTPTIPFYLKKYNLEDLEVIGLMVGARGTIPKFFASFWKRFGLPMKNLCPVIVAALRGSIYILRSHLYGP